jgi:hypothetical protein
MRFESGSSVSSTVQLLALLAWSSGSVFGQSLASEMSFANPALVGNHIQARGTDASRIDKVSVTDGFDPPFVWGLGHNDSDVSSYYRATNNMYLPYYANYGVPCADSANRKISPTNGVIAAGNDDYPLLDASSQRSLKVVYYSPDNKNVDTLTVEACQLVALGMFWAAAWSPGGPSHSADAVGSGNTCAGGGEMIAGAKVTDQNVFLALCKA